MLNNAFLLERKVVQYEKIIMKGSSKKKKADECGQLDVAEQRFNCAYFPAFVHVYPHPQAIITADILGDIRRQMETGKSKEPVTSSLDRQHRTVTLLLTLVVALPLPTAVTAAPGENLCKNLTHKTAQLEVSPHPDVLAQSQMSPFLSEGRLRSVIAPLKQPISVKRFCFMLVAMANET